MSTLSYTFADSATMLRRQLRHMLRYPTVTVLVAALPRSWVSTWLMIVLTCEPTSWPLDFW